MIDYWKSPSLVLIQNKSGLKLGSETQVPLVGQIAINGRRMRFSLSVYYNALYIYTLNNVFDCFVFVFFFDVRIGYVSTDE